MIYVGLLDDIISLAIIMNQIDKASLVRQLLKPKQFWLKDSEVTHCFACQKQFLPIVRWRHHCRFCGNIFCSKCSENIIYGEDIDYKEEKRLRHCQKCRERIKKTIAEQGDGEIQRKSNTFDIDDHQIKLELDQTTEASFISNTEDEKTGMRGKDILERVSRDIEEEVGRLAFQLCGRHQLDCGTWAKRMADLVLKTINEVQVDTFVRPEPFSLLKQIRVLTIATPRDCVTAACVRGLILQRNVPSKALSTHIKYPNILIFRPAIQAQSLVQTGEARFDSMVKNQAAILKAYLQKIYKLQPNVIFVAEHVSKLAYEQFLENGIMVISKVRREDLRVIQRLALIRKSIDHLQFIDKYRPSDVLGVCERIYFKTVKQGEMLMFIQQDQGGIRSVLLGDCSEDINAKLKVAFTQLLSSAWALRKTREMIVRDIKFMGEEKLMLVLGEVMDWSRYYPEKGNALEMQGTKIVYKCQKSEELTKPYEAYCNRVGHPFFLQFCDFPKPFRTRFYEDNLLLGTYLLKSLADTRRSCRRCSTTHVQRYYINNHYVTIRFQAHQDRLTGKIMPKQEDSEEDQPNQERSEALQIYQSIVDYLQKSKDKMFFMLYFRCDGCEQVIGGTKIRIGRDYLSIHFFHYLAELINSYQKARQSCPSYDSRKQHPCSHPLIARIIQCPRLLVKFYVSQSQLCQIAPIELNEAMRNNILAKDQKFLKEIYMHQIKQKALLIEQLQSQLHKMPFSLSTSFSISSISGFPPHQHPYFQYFMRVTELLGCVEQKLSEIQSSYLGYFTTPEHDWTISMRKFHKIEHVLKVLYDIINHISNGLKKEKYQEATEDLFMTESPIAKMRKDSIQTELGMTSPARVVSKFNSTASMVSLLAGMRKETGGTELQQMDDIFKKSRKYRFPLYQGVHLYYPIGNINDPVSLLACCLNSADFKEYLREQTYRDFITCRLTFNKLLQTQWGPSQESYRIYRDLLREDYLKNETYEYYFSAYYHRQFQELRMSEGVDFGLYVRSLYGCQNWDSSGGKSNSTFSKSHNEILVVKIINQKEFVEFQKFAPAYLKYMKDKRDNGGLSYLAKIYGIYQATIRNKIYKFVVMQNIFIGMTGPLKVYDLKGSEVNRLATPVGDQSFTGLDTNFTIDKDGRPYILDPQVYDTSLHAFQDDAGFLKDQSVIDYSLLVIQSQRSLRMGIIDFMRPYHFIQKIETIYKEIKSGKDPTVIPPLQYSERFISAMRKYFIKVSSNGE